MADAAEGIRLLADARFAGHEVLEEIVRNALKNYAALLEAMEITLEEGEVYMPVAVGIIRQRAEEIRRG